VVIVVAMGYPPFWRSTVIVEVEPARQAAHLLVVDVSVDRDTYPTQSGLMSPCGGLNRVEAEAVGQWIAVRALNLPEKP
jgi:hypothetical protein